jgi:hypothetical protein
LDDASGVQVTTSKGECAIAVAFDVEPMLVDVFVFAWAEQATVKGVVFAASRPEDDVETGPCHGRRRQYG